MTTCARSSSPGPAGPFAPGPIWIRIPLPRRQEAARAIGRRTPGYGRAAHLETHRHQETDHRRDQRPRRGRRHHHDPGDGYPPGLRKGPDRLCLQPAGAGPEGCSTLFLTRLVGFSQAAEWIYTGRIFSAQEALAGRLVSRVLPEDELLPAAIRLAREIAENTSAVSTALSRHMLWDMLGCRPSDGGPPDRIPLSPLHVPVGRFSGRHHGVFGKTPAALYDAPYRRHAGLFPLAHPAAL